MAKTLDALVFGNHGRLMDFTGLDSGQPRALVHARSKATWQLFIAWSVQALIFLALWLSDNPQWVWYSLLRDGGWARAISALLVFGMPALVVHGLWTVRSERAAIWPAFVLPAVALVSGGTAAALAYGRTMDLAQVPSVRDSGLPVYAAASASAQSILSVTFFVTAFLSQFAAPIFLARATVGTNGYAPDGAKNARGTAMTRAVAAVASVLALVGGFGLGWSVQLAIIVLSINATCALVLSILVAARTTDLRCSSLAYVGVCLGVSQVCFVASFLARSRAKLFTFFDHPDFSPDALASFANGVEHARVFTHTLPWLLLLPLSVVMIGLIVSGGTHFWRWTTLPLLPFVLGAGSLVSEEPISDTDLIQLRPTSKPEFADKIRLPVAFLGNAEVWSEKPNMVVASSAQVTALARDGNPVVLDATNLLRAPECRTRLTRIKRAAGTVIAADTSLDTRELDCLLIGTLALQTSDLESDGASGIEPLTHPNYDFCSQHRYPRR